ncbi:response regulator transcription factor [Actinotignum urinale]|uniref:Response regulator transcription factor n=1 Tax=Actinotignum urinale TaxID=190146 RepID=A0AAW9HXU7_9ACTO|nr:response regulator transcription factor [Actinotignum urinale]MDY5152334.1 response regulator transcription factor [Actinotignum urinale]MDY5155055.1 response regulator transcription factor [Actinotignum urinale]
MTRITIVEDQTILLDSLAVAIDAEADFMVVNKLTDAADIHASQRLHPADLVLMDVVTENSSGLKESARFKAIHPSVKVVVFTAMPDASFVEEARAAGVDAFTYKNISTSALLALLRSTIKGENSFPDTPARPSFGANQFNDREMQVLRLVCAGYPRKEIAKKMFLSENTIKSYISQLLAKSGFSSVARLALWAVSNGYVAIQENRSDPDLPS